MTRVRLTGRRPRQSLFFSARVASENSAAQPMTIWLNCVPDGSWLRSRRTSVFRVRRAVGRPDPKKLSEPDPARASTLPLELAATARLRVPPPSIPMTTVGLMFLGILEPELLPQEQHFADAREFLEAELFVESFRPRIGR